MRRFRFAQVAGVRGPGGAVDAWVAERSVLRLLGLAGLAAIPAERALLIPRCAWVHTGAMRFALDVAFLEWPPRAEGSRCTVLAVAAGVPSGRSVRLAGRPGRATAVLEVPAQTGFLEGAEPGARLAVTCRSPAY
jgi:hypothetical protein